MTTATFADRDETLAALAERCVRSALPVIKTLIDQGATPKNHSSTVEIIRSPDGSGTTESAEPATNYASLIDERYVTLDDRPSYEDLDGYEELRFYLRSKPQYLQRLSGGEAMQKGKWGDRWFGIKVSDFVGRLTDRHIHTTGWEFDLDKFSEDYVLLERGLLGACHSGEPLTVDVWVPLYGVTLSTPTKGPARIERLTDDLLAACWLGAELEDYDKQLLLNATHAWVQPGVSVTIDSLSGFANPEDLDFDQLDRLLEVMSVQAVNHGIKHVLYRPNNWVESWAGDLPAAGRWSWTYERTTTELHRLAALPKNEELREDELQRRLQVLTDAPHEIRLAARRLFMAACRSDPIDAVVDACIGIEALVGDDNPNDITYKLAVRTVALVAHAGYSGFDSRTLFTTVKNLYSRRSKIVHGKLKPQDDNKVKALGGSYSANAIGSIVLSLLLQIVLDDPTLIGHISNDDLVLSMLIRREIEASAASDSNN